MTNPTPAHVAALAALFHVPGTDLPDPLGPDADGVWQAPTMKWLAAGAYEPTLNADASGFYYAQLRHTRLHEGVSGTAALLQACLAARVPEVCRAMGVEA